MNETRRDSSEAQLLVERLRQLACKVTPRVRPSSRVLREAADTIDSLHSSIASAQAALREKEGVLARARALLDPNCATETLFGAIRNLQQAHLSEKGNAEHAEAALQEARRLRVLAKEATNGWGCYAKRDVEHTEIARLHREIDATVAAPPVPREGK